MKLNILSILIVFIFSLSFVSAIPSISINSPEEINYTTSINIPIDVTTFDSIICSYNIDEIENISFTCGSFTGKFDVDKNVDGNHTFNVYADDGVDTILESINFNIDRNFDTSNSIALLSISILLIFFILCLVIVFLKTEEYMIKMFFFGLLYLGLMFLLSVVLMMAREFLKVIWLIDIINVVWIIGWVLLIPAGAYIIFVFVMNSIELIKVVMDYSKGGLKT